MLSNNTARHELQYKTESLSTEGQLVLKKDKRNNEQRLQQHRFRYTIDIILSQIPTDSKESDAHKQLDLITAQPCLSSHYTEGSHFSYVTCKIDTTMLPIFGLSNSKWSTPRPTFNNYKTKDIIHFQCVGSSPSSSTSREPHHTPNPRPLQLLHHPQ